MFLFAFQWLSVSLKEKKTNIFRSRHNFKCTLLLNCQMPGSPSPRLTRVPGRLNTFSETVVTFDPCQATMRLGHVVEQAHSYLSVSWALARGQLSSQPRGRRVHSHGAVPGLADQKKRRKALSTLRCFSFLRWVPLTTAWEVWYMWNRPGATAWSPRWGGEREFSKLVQHLGTQHTFRKQRRFSLYNLLAAGVAAGSQPCLKIRRSRVRSRPRAFLRGGCLFLPASSRVPSWDPIPSQKTCLSN